MKAFICVMYWFFILMLSVISLLFFSVIKFLQLSYTYSRFKKKLFLKQYIKYDFFTEPKTFETQIKNLYLLF